MDKKTGIIIGVILIAFAGLLGITLSQSSSTKVDYDKYDISSIIDANEDNGYFGDIIEGDPNAPIIIFEYGDYQCTACAPANPYVNELVEEYNGKVAVVFRTMIMSYHQNGTAAASAALAAHKQGYWLEFKDTIFANLNEWYYASTTERQDFFDKYFLEASNNEGDLDQFHTDMASKEVAQKIRFDAAISEKREVSWTPTFYFEDELIDNYNEGLTTAQTMDRLREKIDARLEELGIE